MGGEVINVLFSFRFMAKLELHILSQFRESTITIVPGARVDC